MICRACAAAGEHHVHPVVAGHVRRRRERAHRTVRVHSVATGRGGRRVQRGVVVGRREVVDVGGIMPVRGKVRRDVRRAGRDGDGTGEGVLLPARR